MKRPDAWFFRILVYAGLGFALVNGRSSETKAENRFPEYRQKEYFQAKAKARAWLDALEVDPVELLSHGVKGKKKLAEILDCYLTLLKHTKDEADRATLRRRVEQLSRKAARPDYHDMARVTDRQFTENSMSYLRVAWLMKLHGINIEEYRKEILKIQPRLDAHLPRRGPWQQAMFLEYYERFALKKPSGLRPVPLRDGVIARRLSAERYNDNETYDFTHEVFVAFDYGNQWTQSRFSDADLKYIRDTLPKLIGRYIAADDADLVGELTSCMAYFGWQGHSAHREAVDFLLNSQNSNGSWGNYEAYRSHFGKYLDQHLYLHTTMVVLQPLLQTYEESSRK